MEQKMSRDVSLNVVAVLVSDTTKEPVGNL